MKKIISLCIVFSIVFSFGVVSAFASDTAYLDANSDGSISNADAIKIKAYLKGSTTFSW